MISSEICLYPHSTQHTAHSTQHTAHSTQHTAHSTHMLHYISTPFRTASMSFKNDTATILMKMYQFHVINEYEVFNQTSHESRDCEHILIAAVGNHTLYDPLR